MDLIKKRALSISPHSLNTFVTFAPIKTPSYLPLKLSERNYIQKDKSEEDDYFPTPKNKLDLSKKIDHIIESIGKDKNLHSIHSHTKKENKLFKNNDSFILTKPKIGDKSYKSCFLPFLEICNKKKLDDSMLEKNKSYCKKNMKRLFNEETFKASEKKFFGNVAIFKENENILELLNENEEKPLFFIQDHFKKKASKKPSNLHRENVNYSNKKFESVKKMEKKLDRFKIREKNKNIITKNFIKKNSSLLDSAHFIKHLIEEQSNKINRIINNVESQIESLIER